MSEAKKIGVHLLEDELAHRLTEKIGFDDLTPELRTYINNHGTALDGYDDTNLRNRVADIENRMNTSTVESDLATLTNKVNDNTNSINELDNRKIDRTDAEDLKKNIQFSDLDSITREKIDSSYSYYQGIMPSGVLNSDTDLTTLIATVNDIKSKMVIKNDLLAYTKNSDKIANTRLETATQSAINQVISGGVSTGGGGTTIIGNYRDKDIPITFEDLDGSLQAKIKGVAEVEGNMQEGIKNRAEQIRDSITGISIGRLGGSAPVAPSLSDPEPDPYYVNFTDTEKGKFTQAKTGASEDGGKIKTASFDMYQQRQIIKNTGNATLYDPLDESNVDDKGNFKAVNGVSEAYKIIDILCWLYYDMIGDFQLLDDTFQEKVCDYSVDRDVALKDPKYFGVAFQTFPVMDAIIYLTSRIRNLEAIIAKMSKENNMRTKFFNEYNTDTSTVIDDNATPNAQNINPPARLKVNNTDSKY